MSRGPCSFAYDMQRVDHGDVIAIVRPTDPAVGVNALAPTLWRLGVALSRLTRRADLDRRNSPAPHNTFIRSRCMRGRQRGPRDADDPFTEWNRTILSNFCVLCTWPHPPAERGEPTLARTRRTPFTGLHVGMSRSSPTTPIDSNRSPEVNAAAEPATDGSTDSNDAVIRFDLAGTNDNIDDRNGDRVASEDTATLHALARRLCEDEQFEQARPVFARLLAEPERVDLDPDELADLYALAARANARAGDPAAAHSYRRCAHDLMPDDDTLLASLAESAFELGAWDEAHRHFALLAARFEPRGDRRLTAVQKRIAEIKRRQIGPPPRAAKRPRTDLHATLQTQTDCENWPAVVATLGTLIEHESDATTRSQYYQAAASVYLDKLGEPSRAVAAFEAALDEDPTCLAAFEGIDRVLTARRQWARLERSYRRMLARVHGRHLATVETMLWRNLAEIYRTRLRDYDAALRAYEIVLARTPEDTTVRVQIVELYQRLLAHCFERYAAPAIEQHHELWRRQPNDTTCLHALYDVYRRLGATDKAYCLASALTLLHRATHEQADMVRRYRRPNLVEAQGRIGESFLDELVLPRDLDRSVTALFGALAPAATAVLAPKTTAEVGRLPPVDLRRDRSRLADTVRYVARVTGLPLPRTLVAGPRDSDIETVALTTASPTASALVVDARAFVGRSRTHMAFAIARESLFAYPAFRVYRITGGDTRRLGDLLLAGLVLGGAQLDKLPWRVRWLSGRLALHLDRPARRRLITVTRNMVQTTAIADLHQWARAVETSALRLGLVLAGDLATAAAVVAHERPLGAVRRNKRALVRELVSFAASPEFFAARERLGTRCLTPRPVSSPSPATITLTSATTSTATSALATVFSSGAVASLPDDFAGRVKRRAADLMFERHGDRQGCTPEMQSTIDALVSEVGAWLAECSGPPTPHSTAR